MDEQAYRVTIRLDPEHDADLIAWLETTPPGSRSTLIREAWRLGLQDKRSWNPIHIGELRQVVAEEVGKALSNVQLQSPVSMESPEGDIDAESTYGAKLDKLLGGFQNQSGES